MLVKRLEHRKIDERLSPSSLKLAECPTELASHRAVDAEFSDPEAAKQRFQHRPFAGGNGAVINGRGRTRSVVCRSKPFTPNPRANGFVFSESRDNGHIDVQIIEPAPTRGGIGADM